LATKPDGSTPDVVLYPSMTLDYKNDPSRRTDAPLLAVEIHRNAGSVTSQSTKDMVTKLEPYFYLGVPSCWIVIPDIQAILVYDSPFHYTFFHENDILKDTVLNIDIHLDKVFE
jgi:hypothetical protein